MALFSLSMLCLEEHGNFELTLSATLQEICQSCPGQELLTGYDMVDSINNRIKQAIQRFINKKKPTTKKTTKTTVTTDCTPAAKDTATPCVNTVTSQVTATTPCENPVTITATCDNPDNVISESQTVCHKRSTERQPRRVRSKRSNSCHHHRMLRSSSRRSKRIRRNRVCNCSAI